MGQREFEEACLRNCRTLVGAGGFIARGSIARQAGENGSAKYTLTEKGEETLNKWEARYGKNWESALEHIGILGNTSIGDQQKVKLIV